MSVQAVRLVGCVNEHVAIDYVQIQANFSYLKIDNTDPGNCIGTKIETFVKKHFETYIQTKKKINGKDFDNIWECLHKVEEDEWMEVLLAENFSQKLDEII